MNWHNKGTYAELLRQAKAAAKFSYPYEQSPQFGAAALFLDEKDRHVMVSGSKVEGIVCAERATIVGALNRGFHKLVAIAVFQLDAEEEEIMLPCGACRELIAQFSDSTSLVIINGLGQYRVSQLLPQADSIRQS
jgi:cytidine deaminase